MREFKKPLVHFVNLSFQAKRNGSADALVAAAPSPGQLWLTCTQVFGAYLSARACTASLQHAGGLSLAVM